MGAVLAALNIEQAAMPGILMLISIIKAHHNATQTWPTEQQLLDAIPTTQQSLKDLWATWTTTHPTAGG